MSDTGDLVIEPEEDGETATPEQKLKKLRDELKKAQKEANDNLAGWQRAKADYVNLERRMRGAGEEVAKYAAKSATLAFIPVLDSLESASRGDHGLSAILKQADEALKSYGIARYTPKPGETFDPARHESVQVLETKSKEEDNTVTQCLQSGYEQDGTIVRPARVVIKHYKEH